MNISYPERKIILDNILERNQTDIVGNGYIDIIVTRSTYENLVKELIFNDFTILSISWWEWCENNKRNEYGLGGIQSRFHNGWYAELPIEIDDIDLVNLELFSDKTKTVDYIQSIIQTKEIKYPNELIKFSTSSWLTPALWLDVPDDWKNEPPL